MEGQATAVRGAAADVLGDGRERERRLGRFAARPAGLAAAEIILGSAALWIRARHAALPHCQRSAIPVAATSAICRATMHGAAQAFGRAREIDAAKSVSLKKQR